MTVPSQRPAFVRYGWIGAAAALAFGSMVPAALADPGRAAASYLVAYAYATSILLGSLFWVMIQHLAGAYGFVALRRMAEWIFAPLPLLALLFVPILWGLALLYPWAEPAGIAEAHVRELVAAKSAYLNRGFFTLRARLDFARWLAWGVLLGMLSSRQREGLDADAAHALVRRQRLVSAIGLPASAFALNFAAVDWLMSLDPAWSSSMFGVYVFAGSALSALAMLIVLTFFAERSGLLRGVVHVSHYHALGKLLLTLLVFWAYVGFFQYFILWIANLPEEVAWYVPRTLGPWWPLAAVLVVGHFALPFLALLSRDLKRRPAALAGVAGWLLAMHYLDVYWIVLPSMPQRPGPHWMDLNALVGMTALVLLGALARTVGQSAVARGDPRFARALRFETE